jgi:hypothetical protein
MLTCTATAALALAVTACGAQPPQAPLAYAKKLSAATSGISTACGYAYRVTAFDATDRARLATLEADASSSAHKLALVYRRNPNWIYQGSTVSKIVSDSVSMLGSCGLDRARARLLHETKHG